MWTIVGLIVATMMIMVGSVALASPPLAFRFYRSLVTPWGLVAAAALRLAFGTALIVASPDSAAGWALNSGAMAVLGALWFYVILD